MSTRRGPSRCVGAAARRRAPGHAIAAITLALAIVVSACSGARPTLSAQLISTGPVDTTMPAMVPTPAAGGTAEVELAPVRVASHEARTGPRIGLGRPVAVIGDSIGAQSAPAILAAFAAAGWGQVVIDAQPSRRIPHDRQTVSPYSGIAALDKVRGKGFDPTTWVIELGTNDIMNTGDDPVALTALITTMLDAIGPGHVVIWISVHNGVEPRAADTFNQILGRFAAARSDVLIGQWATVSNGAGLVSSDRIHLTPAGEQAFAADLVLTAGRSVPDDPPARRRRPI